MPKCTNKHCDRLGVNLPCSEFNKGRRTCKTCDRRVAREHRKREWDKRRDIIDKLLGKRCVVCGSEDKKRLRCHEVYGRPHKKLLDTSVDEVEENCKRGRFARVCARCHGKAHALKGKGIDTWDDAKSLIGEFNATNPSTEEGKHLREWHGFLKRKFEERQLPLPL